MASFFNFLLNAVTRSGLIRFMTLPELVKEYLIWSWMRTPKKAGGQGASGEEAWADRQFHLRLRFFHLSFGGDRCFVRDRNVLSAGIAYESKNETAQAAAYAPHPCDGDGTAACHSNAQPIRKKRAPPVLTDLLEAVI